MNPIRTALCALFFMGMLSAAGMADLLPTISGYTFGIDPDYDPDSSDAGCTITDSVMFMGGNMMTNISVYGFLFSCADKNQEVKEMAWETWNADGDARKADMQGTEVYMVEEYGLMDHGISTLYYFNVGNTHAAIACTRNSTASTAECDCVTESFIKKTKYGTDNFNCAAGGGTPLDFSCCPVTVAGAAALAGLAFHLNRKEKGNGSGSGRFEWRTPQNVQRSIRCYNRCS